MNSPQDSNITPLPLAQESLIFVDTSLNSIIDSLTPSFGQQLHTFKDINDITAVLAREKEINSIHIFSEGNSGLLELGETRLHNNNIAQYSQDLSIWGQALSQDGDILFYGCNVGQGKSGEDFLTQFASFTGGDIAASDDLTGNSNLGGDWDLEVKKGVVETPTIVTPSLINSFSSVLLSSQITVDSDSKLVTFTGNLQDNSLYLSVENDLISYSFNGLDFSNIDIDSSTQGIQGLSISTFVTDLYGIDVNLGGGNDNLFVDYSFAEAIALQSFNSIEDTSNLTLQNISTSWNLFEGEGFIDFNWEIFDSTDNSTFTDGYSGRIGFRGIEGFTGGVGKDNFILHQDLTTNITLDGGLGENTLTGANLDNNWTITGVNGGNVNSNVTFLNINNLTGGLGDDEFTFNDGGSITGTIDGGSEGYFDYNTASSVIEIKEGDRIVNDDGKIYQALTSLSIPTATGNEFTDEDTPNVVNVGDRIVLGGAIVFEAIATISPEGDATTLDLTDESQEYFNNENWQQITLDLSNATRDYANNPNWQEVNINGDTVSFAGYSDGITVDLELSQIESNGNVISQFANFENLIGSDSNEDNLKGKAVDSVWNITGSNAGNISEINFSSFENLTGGNEVDDFFLFDGGSSSGIIDGGLNGNDNFGVKQNDGTTVIFNEYTNSEIDENGNLSNWFGVNVNYANLDANQTVIFNATDNSQTIKGTNSEDEIIIRNSATQGEIEIEFIGRFLANSSGNQVADIRRINDFGKNLVIELKDGDDNLTIESFDPTFNKDLTIKGQGDDDFVTITGDVFLNGGNLTISAEEINVDKGVIVSTRQVLNGDKNNHIAGMSVGDSGDITFTGKIINVGVNGDSQEKAQLLSHADSNLSQGDVNLEVIDDIDVEELLKSNIPFLGIRDSKAEITLDQVNIQGGLVNLSSIASHNNDVRITDLGYGEFNFNFLPDIGLPNNPIFPVTTMGFFGGVSISKATAKLTMTENSSVTASEFKGSAVADGNAVVQTVSIGLSTQIGILTTKANVDIQGDITVTNGNLSLNALTKNVITVSQNPLLSFFLPSIGDVSISILNSDSIINIGHQSSINVLNGNFTAYADTITTNITRATSQSGNDGRLGLAFALSMETKTTNVLIDGNVTANGNIDIVANQTKDLFNLQDSQVSASASSSLTSIEREQMTGKNARMAVIGPLVGALSKKIGTYLTPISEKMKGQSLPFRFSAATAFTQEENNVNARIGDGVNTNQVTSSNGFVNVNSVINSRPDVSATSNVAATREFIGAGKSRKVGKIDYNDAKFTGTTAIAIGLIENNANAYINTGAKVDASQYLTVKSETINDYQNNFGVNLVEPFTQNPNFSSDEGEKVINLGNIVKVASNHDKGGSPSHYYQYIGGNSGSIIDLSQEDFSDANLLDFGQRGKD